MKRTFLMLAFVFALTSAAGWAGAGEFDLDRTRFRDFSAFPAAPGALPPTAPEPKEWTVMFYSTTKDRLRHALLWQLLEMKKTGSTEKVNVVAQAAFPVKDQAGAVSTPTIRMALGKAGDPAALDQQIATVFMSGEFIPDSVLSAFSNDIVSKAGATDTGDWKKVADFTKWAKANYPAKRYAFVIYGHGMGILDPKKGNKGTLQDTDTGNYVTLPEMRLMMAATGKVDAFVMTSCIMQMAEVAWQIMDYTDVIVGSSELMSSVGYDLKGMLDILNASPGVPSEELGAYLADSYVERVKAFRIPGGHASVLLTSGLPAFAGKLNAWAEAEMAANDLAAIAAARKAVARFDIFGITMATSAVLAQKFSIAGDLYDFVSLLTEALPQDTPERARAAQKGRELMEFISKDLLFRYVYTGISNTGFDYGRAHGVSIHIPPIRIFAPSGTLSEYEKNMETLYWDLPFAKETKWGEFLSWIYGRKQAPAESIR